MVPLHFANMKENIVSRGLIDADCPPDSMCRLSRVSSEKGRRPRALSAGKLGRSQVYRTALCKVRLKEKTLRRGREQAGREAA